MIRVIFQNLKPSEFVREIAVERVEQTLAKFPKLLQENTTIKVSMENSPVQAGPDVFKIKLFIPHGYRRPIVLEKAGKNLYEALATLNEKLSSVLEKTFSRQHDRRRLHKRDTMLKWA